MQHCLAVLLLDLLAVCLVRAASTTSATTTSMWDLQPWLHQASRKSASTVSAREGQGCRAFVQAVLPVHWAVLSAIMKSPGPREGAWHHNSKRQNSCLQDLTSVSPFTRMLMLHLLSLSSHFVSTATVLHWLCLNQQISSSQARAEEDRAKEIQRYSI